MNELALFPGAGGGLLASRINGWRTICAVEINGYRRSVLQLRQCEGALDLFPIWDDVRTFDGLPWRGRVDVVSGGFPCQAYSPAARGKNVADDLWPEMRRIVAETAPRYVFAENVSREAIHAAAEDLCDMGYTARCIPLSAADLGGDHIRQRYWLRAYTDDEVQLCDAIDAEVGKLSRLREGIWTTDPRDSRVVDGLAHRVERLEATGDGQVPIVAAAAWRILSSHHTSLNGAYEMNNIHGTCGRCGGRVTTPRVWGGIHPPIPSCESCGAQVKQPHGPVLDMEDAPKRYDNVAGYYGDKIVR